MCLNVTVIFILRAGKIVIIMRVLLTRAIIDPSAMVRLRPSAMVRLRPSAMVRLRPSAMVRLRPSGMVRLRPSAMVRLRTVRGSTYSAGHSHDSGHTLFGGGSLDPRKQQLGKQKMTCRLHRKPMRLRCWDGEPIAEDYIASQCIAKNDLSLKCSGDYL